MPNKITAAYGSQILVIDWINHEGKAWLVPAWRLSLDGKMQQPVRIVSMRTAAGIQYDLGEVPLRFFEENTIPAGLLDGLIPPGLEKLYEVREAPDIWLPNPEQSH